MPRHAFYSFLEDQGVLAVSGADAGAFLQGQFSTDMLALPEHSAQLTSLNDARGRTLCVSRVLRLPDAYLLILPVAEITAVTEHLSRFVLRARVRLEDRSRDLHVVVVAHPDLGSAPLDLPGVAGSLQVRDGNILTQLPRWHDGEPAPDELECALILTPAARGKALRDELQMSIPQGQPERWHGEEIRAGVPTLEPPFRGKYLAQWLNLDLVGAISFAKGCFSGQEVLARTKYRGRITRRMLRLKGETPVLPAGSVLTRDGANAGEVLRSASGQLLAVVRLDGREGAFRTDSGVELRVADLPYAIPELETE